MTQKRDSELVALAKGGDKAAFGQLIERYEQMVKRLALVMVQNEYIAQELAQETLLQAYLSLSDLRIDKRFKSWLYGITLNVCKSHIRNQKIDFLSLESLLGGMVIDVSLLSEAPSDPQTVAEARDLHHRILAAINLLSPKNRAATLLFYYDQLTLQEIATVLGVSVAAVKGRLHKSRKQLKTQLFSLYTDMHQITQYLSTAERRNVMGNAMENSMEKAMENAMIEVTVADIAFKQKEGSDPPDYYPIVTLLDEAGKRLLFIWIGRDLAETMAMQLLEYPTPRPLTYTFMANLLQAAGAELEAVEISALKKATFIATVKLRVGEIRQEVDARPSDAINLALHMDRPIYVAAAVMERASIDISEAGKLPAGAGLDLIKERIEERRSGDPRFTMTLNTVLGLAIEEARRLNHEQTGAAHLLLGLMRDKSGAAIDILQDLALDIDLALVRERIEEKLGQGQKRTYGSPPQSPRLERVLKLAVEEASQLGYDYIGTEHALLGLLVENEGVAIDVLKEFVILDLDSLRERIKAQRESEETEARKKSQFEAQQKELVALVLGDTTYEISGNPI